MTSVRQLARIAAVAVGDETRDHGIHRYELAMPLVPLAQMEREITAQDVLIVNPSFSSHQFGWRLPGFKICYVQGFNTFSLLDLKIDHFVAVSDFVRGFLHTAYGIDAVVIPPFVGLTELPPARPWEQRPAEVVLPYRKGMPEVWDISWLHLREILQKRAPQIVLADMLPGSGIPHGELLGRLGQTRFFLTLSPTEGFGLVPLEAMAMGAAVVGYDGFGGRHYMRSGENCAVAPYPQIERVAEQLIELVLDPARAEAIAQRGHETAMAFSYEDFRRAWIAELNAAVVHAGST